MMKECAQRAFLTLPQGRQQDYHRRYGSWYEARRQYLHAMAAYHRGGDDHALLRVIRLDAGILLASLKPETVLDFLDNCPAETLKAHPLALLVLMRSMFNWRRIPKMLELKELLLSAISEDPDMDRSERGNLLGECDLIMSFLMYNDISAMSRLHRSASTQMSRPAISIQNSGGWTFGSPSVLMMFHRQNGALDRELAEMDECMPHYYKITQGHGQGAETIMAGEAALMQGRFSDAHIHLERAYAQIEGNGQENMALCADFLALRLSLCADTPLRYTPEQRRAALLGQHNASWVNIFTAACSYYYALLEDTDRIPELFAGHRLSSVNFLAPGRPMMDLIENQVYLAQGAWAKVIGRAPGLLAACGGLHYALVALHIHLQTAAAYAMLGKERDALALLHTALSEAQPDGLILPFVENLRYLKDLLPLCPVSPLTEQIADAGSRWQVRCRRLTERDACPAAFASLTQREREVAALAVQRLSNREIAQQLFLSEGSVKQYINQIYSKLHIEGDARTKRAQLIQLANS